jgi:hypothetical protein
MSYTTIAQCAADPDFRVRMTSCLAQEGVEAPLAVGGNYIWQLASAPDIEAAYASALAAGNPAPGLDESVISDVMILAFVQANPPPSTPAS